MRRLPVAGGGGGGRFAAAPAVGWARSGNAQHLAGENAIGIRQQRTIGFKDLLILRTLSGAVEMLRDGPQAVAGLDRVERRLGVRLLGRDIVDDLRDALGVSDRQRQLLGLGRVAAEPERVTFEPSTAISTLEGSRPCLAISAFSASGEAALVSVAPAGEGASFFFPKKSRIPISRSSGSRPRSPAAAL